MERRILAEGVFKLDRLISVTRVNVCLEPPCVLLAINKFREVCRITVLGKGILPLKDRRTPA